MEEANNLPQTKNTKPWLRYAGIGLAVLIVVNIVLFVLYLWRANQRAKDEATVGTLDEQGFLLTIPGKTVSRGKYSITFSNPRYEKDGDQNIFKVNVEVSNTGFPNAINLAANCSLEEAGVVVKEGVGVGFEGSGVTGIRVGSIERWTSVVTLDNSSQKVTSCSYSPVGIFDPELTTRVVF